MCVVKFASLLAGTVLLTAATTADEPEELRKPKDVERRIFKAIEAGDLDVVQSLWTDEVEVNRRFAYWPNTFIYAAACEDNPKIVAWLLEHGANPNIPGPGDKPVMPIQVAARNAQLGTVELLAAHGAELDPLSAVALNDPQAIRRFIEADRNLLTQTWHFDRISEDQDLLHFAAAYGNVEAIRTLIELGADPRTEDANGFSALYLAAAWTKADAVRELLKHDDRVNQTNRYGWSPLRAAAHYKGAEAADVLLKAGATLDVFSAAALGRLKDVERFVEGDPSVLRETVGFDTPLTWAVNADQPEIVRRLIELGAAVNAYQKNMENAPLQRAAWDNHIECAKILIGAGADLNVGQRTDAYGTPLHQAAWRGHDEMVKLLLEFGADIEAVDNTGDTPLAFAASQRRIETMKLLLAKGANPNGAGDQSPLTKCIDHDDMAAVKLLIEAGANGSKQVKSVGSPLHHAIRRGNMAMTELLLAQPVDMEIRGENKTSLLHVAPLARDTPIEWRIKLIDRLIEMGFDLEASSYGGYTVLARAVYNRKEPRLIKHLIEKGADVNAATNQGATVIHVACYGNQADIVKMLIEHGAEVDVADRAGKPPLRLVVGDPDDDAQRIVGMLLEAGASVDVQTMAQLGWHDALTKALADDPELIAQPIGKGLLHTAASRGDMKMLKMLLEKGAPVDGRDEDGMSAMHRAALAGKPEVVEYLLKQGANPNQAGKYQHALYSAAIAGSAEITKMLIDAGAEVDKKTSYQYTALSQASAEGKLEVVKVLVEAGADVNRVTKDNETAVTAAVDRGQLEVLKYLLANGGQLEGFGDDYSPYLHDAATRDTPDMLAFLLKLGLWVNQPNERGDTALDWAMPDDPHNAKLLREAGGLPGHLINKDPVIAKLLAELDDASFENREAADIALREIGRGLLPALQRYVKQVESAEVKLRLEQMISDFEKEVE